MTNILRLRERRFHALYSMLTGEAGAARIKRHDLPDHLSRGIGLPGDKAFERPASHLGIYL